MALLPVPGEDVLLVRLRSSVRGTFLYADEDRIGVSLSLRQASPNAVWEMRGTQREGAARVVFRGSAYGRYLALSADRRVLQVAYDDMELRGVAWRAVPVASGGVVLLVHVSSNDALRASDRPGGVTADSLDLDNEKGMTTHWVAEVIQGAPRRPVLPPPSPPQVMRSRRGGGGVPDEIEVLGGVGAARGRAHVWAPLVGVAGGRSRGPFWLPLLDARGAFLCYAPGPGDVAFRDGRGELDAGAVARLTTPPERLRGGGLLAVLPAARVPVLVPLRLMDAAQAAAPVDLPLPADQQVGIFIFVRRNAVYHLYQGLILIHGYLNFLTEDAKRVRGYVEADGEMPVVRPAILQTHPRDTLPASIRRRLSRM